MPVNSDSYSTTIGSSFDTRRIINPIKEAVITDDLDTQRESTQGLKAFGGFHPLFITGTYPSENKVPNFPHPISIKGIRGKNFICSDLRLVLRENKGGLFTDRIKNLQEYSFIMNRHKLTTFWVGGRSSEFRTSLRFGAFAFSAWLSGAIGHLKGLDAFQRIQTQIVLLCYYADLTADPEDFKDPLYRTGQIPWIDAMMKNAVRDIETTIYAIGKEPMLNLDECVDRIKKVLDSPLLTNLNGGVLAASIKSHWFGQGVEPQKIIGVAVEDPPTWCALVLAALEYSGYKNSMIAQTVNQLGKRGDSESFVATCRDLFDSSLKMESIAQMVSEVPDDNSLDYEVDELVLRAETTPDFSKHINKEGYNG